MHRNPGSSVSATRGLARRRNPFVALIRLGFVFALVASGFSSFVSIPGIPAIEEAEATHTNIKLPVPAGETWRISQGYNTNPATGGSHYGCDPETLRDEPSGTRSCSQYWQYKYSFDLVPADGSSAAGHVLLSPVNGVIRWIDQAYGGMSINLEDGYALAYFHTTLAPGLAAGQRVTQGQYLGTVAPSGQGGNGGFPHIHITLWQTTDGGNWSRTAVPFAGSSGIEGVSLPAQADSSVNQHRGGVFTSTNVALAQDAIPPAAPVHLAPAHGLTYDATSQVVTLDWAESDGGTEYQVWMNDAPASGWISASSWTSPSLGTGQYAWQVRARGAGGEGSLSGKWVFWVDPSGGDDLPPLSTTPGPLGVTSDPTSAAPGANVVITGAGMRANETVNVTLDNSSGNSIGRTTANSAGNWRIVFTLPDTTGGQHQFLARGATSNRSVASTFTVNASLQRSPISGVPGTKITVTVKGFGADELVGLTFYHSSTSQHSLNSVRTNSNGTGTTEVTLPSSTTGQHDYRGVGQTSGRSAWGALWIQPSIELSDDQGSAGDEVTATVRGMPGSTAVRLSWNQSGSSSGATLCNGATSSTGSYVCVFTIPSGSAGAYPITATAGGTSVAANFAIAGAAAMTMTPANGAVGSQFQISLGGFQANETVRVSLDGSSSTWRQVTVAANGTALIKSTIPYLANGTHSVTALGATSGRSATGTLTISPGIELSQSGGAAGSDASAWMRGFKANTNITLRFNSTNASNGSAVCSGRTDGDGSYHCSFDVPALSAATYPVRAVSDGLSASVNFAVTTSGEIVGGAVIGIGTYEVTATREGLVGGTTSNGHVIVENDHFVALPACTPSNCPWLTGGSTHPTLGHITDCGDACFVRVTNPATGICRVEPIYDTGPWFTNDNWWAVAEQRNLNNLPGTVNILPQGYPGTDAARDGLDVGYGLSNGIGISNVGYETGNRAAIDIADGTWQDIGFAYAAGIGTVIVSLLWQTGEDVEAARDACFAPPGNHEVDPAITISSLSGHVGDAVTINGTGYGAGEAVNIFWDRTSSGSPIATTRASASGSFSVVVTIPSAEPGSHYLVGKGVTTDEQASRTYVVLPPTRIHPDPLSGAPGSGTTVNGVGFHRGEPVTIYWGSTGSNGQVLGSATANFDGEFTVNVTIPNASAGGHYIVGLGGTSGLKASRTFTVTDDPPAPSDPRIAIDVTTGFVGAEIDVIGTGYGPNESVQLYWDSTGSSGILLKTITAGSDGSFETSIIVPEAEDGRHLIVGRGVQSGKKPSRSIMIQSAPAMTGSATSGAAGDTVAIEGVRFFGLESIQLFWDTVGGTPLSVTSANPDGSFEIGVAIPSTANPGEHEIIARGATSGFEARLTFTISAAPSTDITISPSSGPPGTVVTVEGVGFERGERVNIRWDNTSSGLQLGTLTADNDGEFSTTITVPDASEGPHRVIAHAQTSGKKPFLDFTVTEPVIVDPRISIDQTQGRTGTVVEVTGTGYRIGETVEIRWKSSSSSAPLMATTTANNSGAFTVNVTIPNVVGGAYRIVGKGLASNSKPTRTFTVTPSIGGSGTDFEPGDDLRMTLRGFQANEPIEIYFDTVQSEPLETVTANSIGVAAVTVEIPNAVNGSHSILAVGGATSAPAFVITVSNGTDQPAEASFPVATANPGETATIDLANYWSGEVVEIYWDDRTTPTSSFVIGSAGHHEGQIAVPSLPGGAHTVTVVGVDSGKSASASITIEPIVVLRPPIGAVGARIIVDVKGWTPDVSASIYFDRPEGGSGGTLVCTGTGRASGTASCSFEVPSGYAVGTVVGITAVGSPGSATALFEVRNDPVGFGPSQDDSTESTPDATQTPDEGEPVEGTPTPDELTSPDPTAEATVESTPAPTELPAEATEEAETPEPTEAPAEETPVEEPTPEPTLAPEPRVVTVWAASDVTVFSARPDEAGTEQVSVLGAGGEDGATAYITFSIEGVAGGTVTDARLVLTGAGSTAGWEAISVIPGLWIDEPGATWNGLPNAGLTAATDAAWAPAYVPPAGNGEATWIDVTTSVAGDGVVTFVIAGSPEAIATFLSRETGNGPRLELTVQD